MKFLINQNIFLNQVCLTHSWIHDQFVHSSWSQSSSDSINDGLARIDVGDDLLLPRRVLRPLLQQQYLRLHTGYQSESGI